MSSSLFNEESRYTLTNVKLNNINTNSKALLYFIYNNVTINKLTLEKIHCRGDIDDSSGILFDSGEEKKKLYITNLKISRCISNGSFIKIKGESNDIIIEKSDIRYSELYGPVIENTSKKVK